MIRHLLILVALATSASADTAKVFSGEHANFTRLVIELPAATEWTLGRTEAGYAFAVVGTKQPTFDLSGVWQRIARNRVTAMDADPATGALMLTLGCECHIFPFEYRAGAVVLDIKPGPPPAGSAFEAAYVGQEGAAPVPGGERAAGYNWLADQPPDVAGRLALPFSLATGEVSLDPLRDALLQQVARGAADGIVDMGLPGPPGTKAPSGRDGLPWSSIRIGELPGVVVNDPDAFVEGTLPSGVCAEDALLDLGAWSAQGSPMELLAAARSGLYGEFDAPDPDAVVQSVRLHLYLGFGAEAQQQADLVTDGSKEDVLALYRSMARIMDGDSDPDTPFATMLDCDGAGALWAALARDRLPAGQGVNRDAILRSYMALPPHLRGHLGGVLADKFLALDDADAARMIRDAMERSPYADSAALAVLDAESDLQGSDEDAALAHAKHAVGLDGNQADGLVALVEAHFRKLEPISPDVTEALLALQGETEGTPLAVAVDRAIVLSQALSGQTEAAFQNEKVTSETLADLWLVTQARAPDDDFLRQAVLSVEKLPAKLAPDLNLAIANRLLALGFADAALAWIGPTLVSDPPARRIAAAGAFLGIGNARTAADLLVGVTGADAGSLRAQALLQLGDLSAAETAFWAAGQSEAAVRASLWQADWSSLDPEAPDAWAAAAQLVQPVAPDSSAGLLGRGKQAVEASVTSRTAIDALLATVAAPLGG